MTLPAARRRGHRRGTGPVDQPGQLPRARRPGPVRRGRRHGRPPGRRGGLEAGRRRPARRLPRPVGRRPERRHRGRQPAHPRRRPERPDPPGHGHHRRRRGRRAPTSDDAGRRTRPAVIANVGDSRAYLFRDGELTQLTEDHSLVADLMREGRITEAEAEVHPQRNIVTRVLGVYDQVDVDLWPVDPVRGDRFLLCSDGLFNEVPSGQIAAVLRRLDDPQDAAAELVRLANEGGGRDNVTVLVLDVVDDGGVAEAASSGAGRRAPRLEPRRPPTWPGSAAPSTTTRGRPPRAPRGGGRRRRRAPAGAEPAAHPADLAGLGCSPCAVLAVVGGAFATIQWYGTSTYFVSYRRRRGHRSSRAGPAACSGSTRAVEQHRPAAQRRARRSTATRSEDGVEHSTPRRGRALRRQHHHDDHHDDDHHHDDDDHDAHRAGRSAGDALVLRAVRRNTELGLIVLGTLVTVGAYLLASLAEDATIPANIGPFLGVVLGLQLAAHLAIRRLAPDADGTLVPIAGLLNGLGYVFIVRIDEAKADPQGLAGLQSALGRRRHRRLHRHAARRPPGARPRALPLDDRHGRHRPAPAAARPRRRPHDQRRQDLGGHRAGQLPARRVRQDPPRPVLRLLPRGEARAAGRQPASGSGPCRSPTPSTSGPCSWPGACPSW